MRPSTTSLSSSEEEDGLGIVNQLLAVLLVSSLSVRSFAGRWHVIHRKIGDLRSSLEKVSESLYWSENKLLQELLPVILSNLRHLKCLSDECAVSTYRGGKLRMQSDLDMASAALSDQFYNVDILLRSGVLCQENAIVLSQPAPNAARDDLGFFVRDLFTRLQIGGIDFKREALEAMIRLLKSDAKSASVVSREGNLPYLIQLLDIQSDPTVREQATIAVSIITEASSYSRKLVFDGGGLGPLLKILDSGSLTMKERAAIAIEAITSDSENAWAISAYGGIPILLESCRFGSSSTQVHSVGAIRNVSVVEDVRVALAEEGVVSVLLPLLISGSPSSTQEKAANCVALLASSGEFFRALILQEIGIEKLLQVLYGSSSSSTDSRTSEHLLRSLTSLCVSDSVNKALSSSTILIVRLSSLVQHGNGPLQQLAVSLLARLSLSCDENRKAIAGCMPTLVRLMDSPKLREAASDILISLMTVSSNCDELTRDEKSLIKLTRMLDHGANVEASLCKRSSPPVAVVSALLTGGGSGCRKRLLAAGAQRPLEILAAMGVAGARKALRRLSGGRFRNFLPSTWK